MKQKTVKEKIEELLDDAASTIELKEHNDFKLHDAINVKKLRSDFKGLFDLVDALLFELEKK